MNDRLNRCLEDYTAETRCSASPEFTFGVLDRLGLADRYLLLDSVLGPVYVAWNPKGVSAVRQTEGADEFEQWFRRRFNRRAFPSDQEPALIGQIRVALGGQRVELPVDLRECTPFESAVLRKAGEIPPGHARPYAWIAREIGTPRAVRAVGSALANNPVPLVIPCHRVVRSDWSTGEYVFGSDAKRELIEHEGLHIDVAARLARQGVRYIGDRLTGEFCLPACGNIWEQVPPSARVELHSAEEAQACGLHACGTCKPIAA
ncbi:MAG: methylated-DNA--[protein]-cysteine S-methyltransferase [Candidatus Eremiobacteraeota bacterium]|nr:methylated-DNA--[protein]-cysteine S-methyltransferase [Candidatus Eremiobacteraeota bacterium]